VQNLNASAAMVGLTAIASSTAGMLIQPKLGELNDRWGARRLMMVSGLLIPILPLSWMFIDAPWQVIPINLLGGVLWGAYGMGSFNYLLMVTPPERRARFSALFQITVTLSLAVGAALGSLVVTQWGFISVFLISGIGRLGAALLFARLAARHHTPSQPAPALTP
jgi:MFS family permease